MKDTIKNLIKLAEETTDSYAQDELVVAIENLLYTLSTTINCPSDWRDIAEELAEEYNTPEHKWIYESLRLWDYISY